MKTALTHDEVIEMAIKSTPHNEVLEIKPFLKLAGYKIDEIYIDRFWESPDKSDIWIYVDIPLLKWYGYKNSHMGSAMSGFRDIVNRNFKKNIDYKLYSPGKFKTFKENLQDEGIKLETGYQMLSSNRSNHMIIS